MLNSLLDDPVVAVFSPKDNEYVRYVKWTEPNTIVLACGKGNIQIFKSSVSDPFKFTYFGNANGIHKKALREIAVNPKSPNIIVTGGYDKKLHCIELGTQPRSLYSKDHNNVISSIKWNPRFENCITMCSDEGGFYLYDARSDFSKAVFYLQGAKDECWCHELYTDYNFMLGYGDGELQHYDMRGTTNHLLHRVADPYVFDGIGDIQYDARSSAFVVSGFTDFSVWKHESSQEAKIWSHSVTSPNPANNVDGYACCASFLPTSAPTVVVVDSQGMVQLFLQDFS